MNSAGLKRTEADPRASARDKDAVWRALRTEAAEAASGEDLLRDYLHTVVLSHPDFGSALAELLALRIENAVINRVGLRTLHRSASAADPSIVDIAMEDLVAVCERDPAAGGYLPPFLHFKGYHALQWHRVAHWLWQNGRRHVALTLQSSVSKQLGVDIHPAVPIGRRVFIDHGTSVVVGETAAIGNDVSILHEVTLGGTGKERGDRHPKVRDGVLLSAGAKILGNIEIGRGAKVGAGSVVVRSVPPYTTVVGVPARIVASATQGMPALDMDQSLPKLNYSI